MTEITRNNYYQRIFKISKKINRSLTDDEKKMLEKMTPKEFMTILKFQEQYKASE